MSLKDHSILEGKVLNHFKQKHLSVLGQAVFKLYITLKVYHSWQCINGDFSFFWCWKVN